MIYYGQTSCDSDLDRYLESMKSLWSRRPQSRDTPVVINTMGWVKGQCPERRERVQPLHPPPGVCV